MAAPTDSTAVTHVSSGVRTPDLSKSETLRNLYETAYAQKRSRDEWRQKWLASHVAILTDVRNATQQQLATEEFRRRLWEDNPLSSSGQSAISMENVVRDRELAEWVAAAAKTALPPPGPERINELEKIYTELCDRVRPLVAKMPWLRILRVMATLFPEDFSNVTSEYRLRAVGRAMFGRLSKEERERTTLLSARILSRLKEALGPTDGTLEQLALRAEFVWSLWETVDGDSGSTPPGDDSESEVGDSKEPLVFPAAARRLRGVGLMPDAVNTILETLEFVSRNRPTRSAVIEFIVSQHPSLQKKSAGQYLYCMWNALELFHLNGEAMELTAAGKAFLDSENPDILIRPLLTKSIGTDLVLWRLNQHDTSPRAELIKALQNHYRRWTSTFMPNAILAWGRTCDLWTPDSAGLYSLTERGKKWAARMTAAPAPVTTAAEPDDSEEEEVAIVPAMFATPALADLLRVFRAGPLVVQDEVVIRLHAALHASESKHFVLLSGLSGTGKTQIALTYANAYHRIEQGKTNPCLLVVSVQPDWTDSTGLLGYVNPLGGEASYVRTDCLKFLLKAHEHPGLPHFLCLDEMNLARVEYYFAPFLSAMETGGRLVFHHEDQAIDNVPPFIPWPRNLYIFGTVNMDETTHAFSDKVLDRAFTIEFWEVDLDGYAERFAVDPRNHGFPPELLRIVVGTLKEAATVLVPIHQHFGYRTVAEVLGFMRACGENMEHVNAMDQAIFMKVLPKIRGQDTEPMRQALDSICAWAAKRSFVATADKARAMAAELRGTGTTRFWR